MAKQDKTETTDDIELALAELQDAGLIEEVPEAGNDELVGVYNGTLQAMLGEFVVTQVVMATNDGPVVAVSFSTIDGTFLFNIDSTENPTGVNSIIDMFEDAAMEAE